MGKTSAIKPHNPQKQCNKTRNLPLVCYWRAVLASPRRKAFGLWGSSERSAPNRDKSGSEQAAGNGVGLSPLEIYLKQAQKNPPGAVPGALTPCGGRGGASRAPGALGSHGPCRAPEPKRAVPLPNGAERCGPEVRGEPGRRSSGGGGAAPARGEAGGRRGRGGGRMRAAAAPGERGEGERGLKGATLPGPGS